jgi:GT2 family glycosyltransferase
MSNISFCINTSRNELDHVKLLFKSLKENLNSKNHEILVFIDSDNQGTFEWLLTQKSTFPQLKILKNKLSICYGYARNINEMFEYASNDIVSYLQSDMVVCKNYDLEILKHLEPNMVLSSTRIEPPLHGSSNNTITYDFGLDPSKFNLKTFTEFAETQKQDKVTEYFFAPFTLYKEVWNLIGGHDTIFRRSREDSDLLIRLVLNDIQIKQTWSAIVYHFTCTSSRGPNWFDKNNNQAQERNKLQSIADNIELRKFIKKWGQFTHSLNKIFYYPITAKILGNNLDLNKFLNFEIFFNKIYVEDINIINKLQSHFNEQHDIANKLLNISSKDWEVYNYMYNKRDALSEVYPLIEISDDIIIEFNLNEIDFSFVDSFLIHLQTIINQTEEGAFEYGPFKIIINKKLNQASNKIVINNPPVKTEHLYSVH